MARRTPYNMLLDPPPLSRVPGPRTALVLIDAQHHATSRGRGLASVAQERGILREFDEYFAMVDAALPNMARLLDAARRHGALVVHTLLVRPDAGRHGRQLAVAGLNLPAGDPADEIRPEVAPRRDETVLQRSTYGLFATTELDGLLVARDVERVILCGMLANVTVVQAARDTADRGFGVVVVQDASASETLDGHAVAMLGVGGGLVRVQWTHEVLELLEGTRT